MNQDIPILTALNHAQKNRYAIGAFNVHNLEMIQAVVEAAEEESLPAIIMVTPSVVSYIGMRFLALLAKHITGGALGNVYLHLDHSNNLDEVAACVEAGFSSVMFDGSQLPFEENIRFTHEVVKFAHEKGVAVEGELGRIPGKEGNLPAKNDSSMNLTDPSLVREYVERTQVDLLAVAIGSSHGFTTMTPILDLNLLTRIRAQVDVPLVLHGGTGIPISAVAKAIEIGVVKINVGTRMVHAFTQAVRNGMSLYADAIDPCVYLALGRDNVKELVKERMCFFRYPNKVEAVSTSSVKIL